jgi:hypothetical protein
MQSLNINSHALPQRAFINEQDAVPEQERESRSRKKPEERRKSTNPLAARGARLDVK